MYYTRNSDPSYFETHTSEANCGSFAFNIQGWYDPEIELYDEVGDISAWIVDLHENDFLSDEEISDIYLEYIAQSVLNDFGNDIRRLNPSERAQNNEEVIVLRTFCVYDECYPNWDFHFKVLRDGLWMEKCGHDPVKTCDWDDWDYNFYSYISDKVYFAKKIG